MEKLIELLNEYEPYIQKDGERHDNIWYFVYKWGSAIFPKNVGESVIISKSYGFIKWLVENDKINTESWPLYWFHFIMHNRQPYSLYETILMILAISDTPIEDLISYLK